MYNQSAPQCSLIPHIYKLCTPRQVWWGVYRCAVFWPVHSYPRASSDVRPLTWETDVCGWTVHLYWSSFTINRCGSQPVTGPSLCTQPRRPPPQIKGFPPPTPSDSSCSITTGMWLLCTQTLRSTWVTLRYLHSQTPVTWYPSPPVLTCPVINHTDTQVFCYRTVSLPWATQTVINRRCPYRSWSISETCFAPEHFNVSKTYGFTLTGGHCLRVAALRHKQC